MGCIQHLYSLSFISFGSRVVIFFGLVEFDSKDVRVAHGVEFCLVELMFDWVVLLKLTEMHQLNVCRNAKGAPCSHTLRLFILLAGSSSAVLKPVRLTCTL